MEKKSVGLIIVSIIFISWGILGASKLFLTLRELAEINFAVIGSNVSTIYLVNAYLVCGFGIVKRKSWARYLGIFLSLWGFITRLPVIYFITDTVTKIVSICISILPLAIIYYLTRLKVKEQFK